MSQNKNKNMSSTANVKLKPAKAKPMTSETDEEEDEEENSISKEEHMKQLLDRVLYQEHHLGKLCYLISEYTIKDAVVRDKIDDLAKGLAKYASDEKFTTQGKLALTCVAEILANVGDHRNAHIQRIESNVLPAISSYGNICKYLKGDVHKAIGAQTKAIDREVSLEKLQFKLSDVKVPDSDPIIEIAQSNLEKAELNASRLNNLVQSQMVKFEQKRMQDLKESLLALFKTEIAFHAKALEYFTNAYQHIDAIDEDKDLEILQKGLVIEEMKAKPKSKGKPKNKPSEGEIVEVRVGKENPLKNRHNKQHAISNVKSSLKNQTPTQIKKNEEKNTRPISEDSDFSSGDSSAAEIFEVKRKDLEKKPKRSVHFELNDTEDDVRTELSSDLDTDMDMDNNNRRSSKGHNPHPPSS